MSASLPILERDWQRAITDLLGWLGWAVCHTRPGRSKGGRWSTPTTAKGWPDLVCLRGEWLVAIEAKGPKTPVEPEQLEWLVRFAALPCGRAWLLRPDVDAAVLARWLAYPERAPSFVGFDPAAIRVAGLPGA